MPTITAYREGCVNANSVCTPSHSDAKLHVRLSGIDKDAITAAEYRIGDRPYRASKSLGNGITITDDGLTIDLSEDDTKIKGRYNHYLQVTDTEGTYKANLNFGRIHIQA